MGASGSIKFTFWTDYSVCREEVALEVASLEIER